MKKILVLVRILFTIIIFYLLIKYISPEKFIKPILNCSFYSLLLVLLITPFFLVFRILKWYVLLKQTDTTIDYKEFISSYLLGMAIGAVTPIRIGEIARLKSKFSYSLTLLFIIEKFVGLFCLFCLTMISVFYFKLFNTIVSILILFILILVLFSWRKLLLYSAIFFNKICSYPTNEKIEKFKKFLITYNFLNCGIHSIFTQIIFAIQTYIILNSMVLNVKLSTLLLIPSVHILNLLPITIGGFGFREAVSVYVLKISNIPPGPAAASVLIVFVIDIIVPGILGIILNLFNTKEKNITS